MRTVPAIVARELGIPAPDRTRIRLAAAVIANSGSSTEHRTTVVGSASGLPLSNKWTKQAHDREEATHRTLHSSGGAHLEQEAGLVGAGIADEVKLAPRYVGAVSDLEGPFGPPDPHGHCPGKDLDALILADVRMSRDPSARVEQDLQLKQLARGISAGLQEGQVLARERVVQMRGLRHEPPSAAVLRPSNVRTRPRCVSRRERFDMPGRRCNVATQRGTASIS